MTCALPSPFAPSPFRAGVPGRIAPVGPGRASRRRAASRLPMGPRSESRGRSRKQRFWARPSDRRDRLEAAGVQSECSGRRGGPKKLKSGRLFFRVDLPVGYRTVLSTCCVLDSWASPWTTCCFLGPSPGVEAGPRGTLGQMSCCRRASSLRLRRSRHQQMPTGWFNTFF